MLSEKERQLNDILLGLAKDIDISPTNFKRAKNAYESVGAYLMRVFYPDLKTEPEIYPQGSFRLGTVVKPITDRDEYDVDLVCQLDYDKLSKTQKFVKSVVGQALINHGTYNGKLDKEKRRCWRIKYEKGSDGLSFHMDILPCVPEDDSTKQALVNNSIPWIFAQNAVGITDKEDSNFHHISNEWPSSNPKGYAKWFDLIKERYPDYMNLSAQQKKYIYQNTFNEERQLIYASLDKVPEQLVRTPLQRAIQILKRHRDIYFQNALDSRPLSIIITTLSARFYDGEIEIYPTLRNIIEKLYQYASFLDEDYSNNVYELRDFYDLNPSKILPIIDKPIYKLKGKWYIPNPVNLAENFADQWDNKKATAFFQWLGKIKYDLDYASSLDNTKGAQKYIFPFFGKNINIDQKPTFNIIEKEKKHPTRVEIQDPVKPWGI